METDNKPKPEVVRDIDGNEAEQITFEPEQIIGFGEVLINTLFGSGIKEGAPPAERQRLLDEIMALCLIRGIDAMSSDLESIDGRFGALLSTYSRKVISRIQDTANALYDAEKSEEGITYEGDKKVLAYLKAQGVKHMPPRRRHQSKPGDILDMLESMLSGNADPNEVLKKALGAMGMPAEDFDAATNAIREEGCGNPDCKNCGGDGHVVRERELQAGDKG